MAVLKPEMLIEIIIGVVGFVSGAITLYGFWVFRKGKILDDVYKTGKEDGLKEGMKRGEKTGHHAALIQMARRIQEEANEYDSQNNM